MNKQKNTFFIVFITFLVTSAMYLGAFTLVPSLSDALPSISLFGGDGSLGEFESLIKDNYYKEIDPAKLKTAALKGYVDALNDPYSIYHTKSEYERLMEDFNGNYRGIGITVSVADNELVIVNVNSKGPAQKAGLKKGDVILKVDGTDVNGDNYNEAVNMIRSNDADAPDVVLTIRRGSEISEVSVARADVEAETVVGQLIDGNIAYVQVSTFAETTDEDFRNVINRLTTDGAKSLIIDLRDNGGGMLTTVVDMADFLLPEGNILTIEGRASEKQEFISDEECIDLPMVVLINGSSASASEVLAGALHDHERATLVGETSFGKGLVQTMFNLKNGGALRLTTAEYYTPSGVCINEKGIAPDHEVVMELTKNLGLYEMDEDIQLRKAIEVAKSKIE